MKSSYGNYVMQKALKVSSGDNKSKLAEAILSNLDKLNDKKLIFKWKQISSEATGKSLSFPCQENFGNYSHNISPNTSFNSANSNMSNNSRNSTKNNVNSNHTFFNNQIQYNLNNNMMFNNHIQNNLNNMNNNFNPNALRKNMINQTNINTNQNINNFFMQKNFSKSYNNSPVNMRMDQIFPSYNNNANNQGIYH